MRLFTKKSYETPDHLNNYNRLLGPLPMYYDNILPYSENMGQREFYFPLIDLAEEVDKYFVQMELPGLNVDDISLDLHDGILTIKGNKQAGACSYDSLIRAECFRGSFRRELLFNDEINEEAVKARFVNGILTIELPKKESSNSVHKFIKIEHH